jgi:hypothetical protein
MGSVRFYLPLAKQLLGLLSPLRVLLLDLTEELHKLLVALSLGVFDVLVVHLPAFCGVVEDATEVEDRIAYACELLSGSGDWIQSPLLVLLTTTSYTFMPTTLRGEAKHTQQHAQAGNSAHSTYAKFAEHPFHALG